MQKKGFIAVLSAIVLMIVASVSLVLAVGHNASANSEEIGILDKAEYFHFVDEEHTIIDGLSYLGCEYADQFNHLEAVIPDGVKEIYGIIDPEYYYPDSVFSYYATKTLPDEEDLPLNYFRGYDVITVTLPETLETIGDYAFTCCDNLTTITIPEKVTTIGNHAFDSCSGLETITIPTNVTTIGEHVFDYCDNLQSIVLENDDLFDHPNLQPYADKLVIIGVLDKAEYFNIDDNGVLCGLSDLGNVYTNQYDELHVVVPEGVTEIRGSYAYYYDIPRYGTHFGAFSWCDGYVSGDHVAFHNYNYATAKVITLRLPESFKVIGPDALYGAELTEIIVENEELLTNESFAPYADIMRYEAPKYIVNFDTVGGNTIDNQVVTKNGTVTEPTAPTKEGYTFKGWFIGDDEYDFTTPVTADMTLTAQWEAIPEQPEPSNPEQPTTPENPEQPTTPDTDAETVTVGSKNDFNIGAAIGGGLVAGLGSISAIAATVIVRRRHK
ncbi:MAG: leucine-rich repeat protein [Clostridia bacterium]|nr:leucine-rich repeat protein [Clostridia bacterium]